jgi:hypothetical protein
MSEWNTEKQAPIRSKLVYFVEGELVTVSQDFPTTRQELERGLNDAGVGAAHAAEFLDSIHETDVYALNSRMPRKPGLDELNHLAHRLAGMDEEELVTFGSILEAEGPWESTGEIINATYNLEMFDLYPGQFSGKDIGGILQGMHSEQYADIMSWLRDLNDPENMGFVAYVERLEASVDLERYGELASQADYGKRTSNGYLVSREVMMPEEYFGPQDIPAEHLLTTSRNEPQHKPSLLGAVAVAREKQAREAEDAREPEHEAPTGPER